MLKKGTLALLLANISGCTASKSACMPPWSIGNALIVKHHAVSMLAVMSPKDGVFCIDLCGGVPVRTFYYFFYTVECASCTKALNKPVTVFCMHTSYIVLVIQKMARLSWKHCIQLT